MHLRLVFAIGLLTAFPFESATAQNPPIEFHPWSFSLGLDPTQLDLKGSQPGIDARMVANLTRTWQSANSRFGRHVSLLAGMDLPYRSEPPENSSCYGCYSRISKRYAALTGGFSYDLVRVSRFTPYLKTGAGLYYSKESRSVDQTFAQLDSRYTRTGFSFGGNVGLGIKARFGSREFFIEQMLHAFDLARRDKGVYPLSIGMRF